MNSLSRRFCEANANGGDGARSIGWCGGRGEEGSNRRGGHARHRRRLGRLPRAPPTEGLMLLLVGLGVG